MIKLEMVDDINRILKRWSLRIVAFGTATAAGWGAIEVFNLSVHFPHWVPSIVTFIIFMSAFVASFLKQPNLPQPSDYKNNDEAKQ